MKSKIFASLRSFGIAMIAILLINVTASPAVMAANKSDSHFYKANNSSRYFSTQHTLSKKTGNISLLWYKGDSGQIKIFAMSQNLMKFKMMSSVKSRWGQDYDTSKKTYKQIGKTKDNSYSKSDGSKFYKKASFYNKDSDKKSDYKEEKKYNDYKDYGKYMKDRYTKSDYKDNEKDNHDCNNDTDYKIRDNYDKYADYGSWKKDGDEKYAKRYDDSYRKDDGLYKDTSYGKDMKEINYQDEDDKDYDKDSQADTYRYDENRYRNNDSEDDSYDNNFRNYKVNESDNKNYERDWNRNSEKDSQDQDHRWSENYAEAYDAYVARWSEYSLRESYKTKTISYEVAYPKYDEKYRGEDSDRKMMRDDKERYDKGSCEDDSKYEKDNYDDKYYVASYKNENKKDYEEKTYKDEKRMENMKKDYKFCEESEQCEDCAPCEECGCECGCEC